MATAATSATAGSTSSDVSEMWQVQAYSDKLVEMWRQFVLPLLHEPIFVAAVLLFLHLIAVTLFVRHCNGRLLRYFLEELYGFKEKQGPRGRKERKEEERSENGHNHCDSHQREDNQEEVEEGEAEEIENQEDGQDDGDNDNDTNKEDWDDENEKEDEGIEEEEEKGVGKDSTGDDDAEEQAELSEQKQCIRARKLNSNGKHPEHSSSASDKMHADGRVRWPLGWTRVVFGRALDRDEREG